MNLRDLLSDLEQGQRDPIRAAQRAMRPALPKRFYREVTTEAKDGSFALKLDGKAVRTPRGRLLAVPTQRIASALAAEWAAQVEEINTAKMPLTRLVNVTIDDVLDGGADAAVAEIVRYAGSDLVCYRAETPASLVARQAEAWDGVLAFARDRLGAAFRVGSGIGFVTQDAAALEAVRHAAVMTPPFALGALCTMTALAGSALIALAVAHDALTPDAAWAAAHIDEDWQSERWGRDEEAQARRAFRKMEWDAAVLVLRDVP